MRLVLITADYPPSAVPCGVGDYTRCLREALEGLGHLVEVFTSTRCAGGPGIHRLADGWGPGALCRALAVLRHTRPDAAFLQYTPEHYGFGCSFKLLPFLARVATPRTLVVTTFHTLVGGRRISKPNAVLVAAGSQGLVSTHAELTALFHKRLPRWSRKLHEIPIGANLPAPAVDRESARRDLRHRLSLRGPVTSVATFGFPAPGKGLETLLEAVSLLGEATHLVCVGQTRGEDRAYRARLESLVAGLGVTRRVHWLGGLPAQEVADLLSGADMYAVPYDEGASLRRGTLLAGFRLGLPLITTTPRTREPALLPGETILSVPPRSPEALAAAIRSLEADPELCDRLRRGGQAVAARFDWPVIAARHIELLEGLRGRTGAPQT